MGRRPSPLVGEFFERGQKLGDASNRYQHSCKRCGEIFPKGRIDSLMNHVLRHCPNMTQEDRHWVFLQYQQKPEPRRNAGLKRRCSNELLLDRMRQDAELNDPSRSSHKQQRQSALDTLAEVSRRHLDYSQRPADQEVQDSEHDVLRRLLAEDALMTELQQHGNTLQVPPVTSDLPSDYLVPISSSDISPNGLVSLTVPTSTSGLMQTASAANRQLESAEIENDSHSRSAVDPQLQQTTWPCDAPQTESHDSVNRDLIASTLQSREIAVGQVQSLEDGPTSSSEPSGEFGVLHRPNKGNSRSRFNDERRKEVQETRKRGACIRCRMLKKPCSEGTPCNTCRSVEVARVWKGACIRTKLCDELPLWSGSISQEHLKHELHPLKVKLKVPDVTATRLEARFYPLSEKTLYFNGHLYNSPVADFNIERCADATERTKNQLWIVDMDEGKLSDCIGEYVNGALDDFIHNERSNFIKATLEQANVVLPLEELEKTDNSTGDSMQKSQRTCYSLQTPLLANVMELWANTQLLISSSTPSWDLRFFTHSTSSLSPSSNSENPGVPSESSVEISIHSRHYRLIQAQIINLIETRCKSLSKVILNEMERRLLQRRQVSRFATFLSAVILLNCAERMSGLYRAMEADKTLLSSQTETTISTSPYQVPEVVSQSSLLTDLPLPLDPPPPHFWSQGDHFADLLIMLLRLRGLPPSMVHHADGTLTAMQDYPLPVAHVSGRPVKERVDQTAVKEMAAWLNPLRLSLEDLVVKRDSDVPPVDAGPEAWDLRFISRVLVPRRI